MAHYVIIPAKGLHDVGFAVVVDYNWFRKIAPSNNRNTWRNISNFLLVLGVCGTLAQALEK